MLLCLLMVLLLLMMVKHLLLDVLELLLVVAQGLGKGRQGITTCTCSNPGRATMVVVVLGGYSR